ncbi:MAG: LysE family translocator [Alphaproteobacteria bacterium]|nr:LysE family translocator [Alphaproteobacteria bacterium]
MIALAIATVLLGLSPGPAVFATISRALALGLRPTYLFILGITLGDLCFSLLAMFGLAALAATYTGLFWGLKIIGGGYLVYLGMQNLRIAKKPDFSLSFKEKGWKLVTSGFLLTASNPKDLLFFVGFLPLFVDLEHPNIANIIIASCVIVASFLGTLSFYAILANSARQWFKSERAIHMLHIAAGILMIGAGAAVIFF